MSSPKPPQTFVFEATQACNHRCAHCYNIWKAGSPVRGVLPTQQTLAMLGAFLDQSGTDLCTLSGGEPLLREDIFDIVDFFVRRDVDVNLVTNGSMLGDEMLERLCAPRPDGSARVAIFELPLLGPEAQLHDDISGAPGAFDRVTDAIAELKLRAQTVVGVFVARQDNVAGFRETVELGVALGLDGMMLNRFNPGGEGRRHVEALQVAPSALQAMLDLAEQASAAYDFPISCSIAMPPCLIDTSRYRRLTFGYCAAGTERAYYALDALGNVRPCNHSATVLGNILEQSFAEMVQGEAMRAFLEARPELCSGCRLEQECQGGCKAAGEVCHGSPAQPDPFLRAYQHLMRKL